MELSLKASFKSESPWPCRFEGCLPRELHFLEALQALTCKLPWPSFLYCNCSTKMLQPAQMLHDLQQALDLASSKPSYTIWTASNTCLWQLQKTLHMAFIAMENFQCFSYYKLSQKSSTVARQALRLSSTKTSLNSSPDLLQMQTFIKALHQ